MSTANPLEDRRRMRLGPWLVVMLSLQVGVKGLQCGLQAQDSATRTEALAAEDAAAQEPTNLMCPVLPDEQVDSEHYLIYRNRRVDFCCARCLAKFRKNPEAYLDNLAKVAPAFAVSPVHAQESDHTTAQAEAHQDQDQDHAQHHGAYEAEDDRAPTGGILHLVTWLGLFHPMVVHFPIALLILAAVAELLAMRRGGSLFPGAARFCLWFGATGAVVAALLGWADAIKMESMHTGFMATVLSYHRWLGTTTAVWAVLTLVAGELRHRATGGRWRKWYRGALFIGVILVAVTGHLGSSLIYGWNYLAW